MTETLDLTPLLEAAAPVLLELFVRGALLLAIAAAAAWALRGASASVRHLVWASALWALLMLPLASLSLPEITVGVLPVKSGESSPPSTPARPDASVAPTSTSNYVSLAGPSGAPSRQAHVAAPLAEPVSERAAATPGADRTVWSPAAAAVGVWAIVAIALLAEMARSRFRLRRLAGGAWRIHDPAWWRAADRIGKALGLRRPVLLLATARTRVPLTWGTRVPIVLLPAEATRWPAERREAVLVHELAHVARGDALGHEIARVAAALFWLNPLVWVAVRMMRAERERACDDLVLATGTRASSYAGDLLEIARTVGGQRHLAAAALAMARPSELEGRLLAILDPRVPRRPAGPGARIAAGALALTMIVPLAALRPAERAASASETSAVARADRGTAGGVTQPTVSQQRSQPQRDTRPAVRVPAAPPPTAPTLAAAPFAAGPDDWHVTLPRDETAAVQAMPPVEDAGRVQSAARPNDLETFIAVARAAAGLSSADDKAKLLVDILARGVRDSGLHAEVLRSASTIGSSHHRRRVLLALLGTGLITGTESQFLGAAEGITGPHDRAAVLTAFARADRLTNPGVRSAFLRAATGLSNTHERRQLLALVIQLPEFDAESAMAILPAIRAISSSNDKANLLEAVARRGVTDDAVVREAFIAAAATLSSDRDYLRVMRAAGLSASDREP